MLLSFFIDVSIIISFNLDYVNAGRILTLVNLNRSVKLTVNFHLVDLLSNIISCVYLFY